MSRQCGPAARPSMRAGAHRPGAGLLPGYGPGHCRGRGAGAMSASAARRPGRAHERPRSLGERAPAPARKQCSSSSSSSSRCAATSDAPLTQLPEHHPEAEDVAGRGGGLALQHLWRLARGRNQDGRHSSCQQAPTKPWPSAMGSQSQPTRRQGKPKRGGATARARPPHQPLWVGPRHCARLGAAAALRVHNLGQVEVANLGEGQARQGMQAR